MSRNQLYKERLELCITTEQRKKIELIAKRMNIRLNEVLRLMINSWEK